MACALSWDFPVALIICRDFAVVVPSAPYTAMMGVNTVFLDMIAISKAIDPGLFPVAPPNFSTDTRRSKYFYRHYVRV